MVYLNGAEKLVEIDPVRLNTEYDYKAVTTNQDVTDASAIPFTWTGGTLRCVAPSNVRGTRNALFDLLIQWTRRSRLGLGLRPLSDVPVGEEGERYEVDILDGSTVLRTLRVFVNQAQDALLIGYEADDVDGNNVTQPPTDGFSESDAYSVQRLNSIGSWAELTFTAHDPTATGIAHFGLAAPYPPPVNIPGNDRDYTVLFIRSGGSPVISMSVYENGVMQFPGAAFGDAMSIRVRIEIAADGVKFYANYSGIGSVPFYVSPTPPRLPYSLSLIAGQKTSLDGVVIGGPDIVPSVFYRATDQTADGLTPGDPVTVRVYQVSAIVGRGDYAEATI